jgi:hypothetical protein
VKKPPHYYPGEVRGWPGASGGRYSWYLLATSEVEDVVASVPAVYSTSRA